MQRAVTTDSDNIGCARSDNRAVVFNGNGDVVACGDMNCIEILNLQAEGKKAMSAADFMRGNPLEIGDKFE